MRSSDTEPKSAYNFLVHLQRLCAPRGKELVSCDVAIKTPLGKSVTHALSAAVWP